MQRRIPTRIASIFLMLAVLFPNVGVLQMQAEETNTIDDEIVYIDSAGVIRVIDPNTATGTQAVQWSSPEGGWFDIATGDVNADGDAEIIAIGNGKVTIFDPVVQPNSGVAPDGQFNQVPWKRLYELGLPGPPNIVSAGNMDQGVAGDEIIIGYSVNEGNGIVYRMLVLKRLDAQALSWTTHATAGYGAAWKSVDAGNIDNQGSEDIVRLRDAATAAVQAAQIDNNWATIFERNRDSFTFNSAQIGQFLAGGTGEVVVTRTFQGTTEAPSVLVYQFVNNGWKTIDYTYFPHPHYAFFADINGNGDEEIFWLRDVGAGTSPRMVMINGGGDALPAFEVGLDADGYRIGDGGDLDADGRDEVVVLRGGRILQFNDPENGTNSTVLPRDLATNGRSLALANLDGNGYPTPVPQNQFAVSTSSLSVSLAAGTLSNNPQFYPNIQLTVTGSQPNVQFALSKENNSSWFTVGATSNTTPANIVVGPISAVNLEPGVYTDRIVVQAIGADVANSPFYIPISLTVLAVEFSVTPDTLNYIFAIGDTTPVQQSIAVSSPFSALTYSAAMMPEPPFQAAAAALGGEPDFGYLTEEGDIVLVNAFGDEYTIEVPEDAQVSASAIVWPSVPWATLESQGNVMPDTLTVTVSPTAMGAPQEKAIVVVVADRRSGAYPDNIKIARVTATKDLVLTYSYLPWVSNSQ